MTYVMVLSETCNVAGATYTVNDIYWNDLRLYFGNGSDPSKATQGRKYVNNTPDPLAASGPYVQIANEDHIDEHFDGKVYINVYAGNTSSAKQIFGKTQNAWDIQYLADHWDSDRRFEGLITAVVQVNYDSEKGFTGLPTLTFKIKNSVDNPAAVLADYMTSDRYGCNIPLANINSSALAAFESFCNESGPYIDILRRVHLLLLQMSDNLQRVFGYHLQHIHYLQRVIYHQMLLFVNLRHAMPHHLQMFEILQRAQHMSWHL